MQFDVPYEIATMSITIKNMIEDIGQDSDAPIPLPNITSKVLEKIIQYCKYHHENPTPVSDSTRDDRKTDDISPWDKSFCDVEQPLLFDLILAANFLDIKPLLDVCCKTVAKCVVFPEICSSPVH